MTAVVTSNELIAWVCIGASVIGVLLLIIDALRERSRSSDGDVSDDVDGDETTVLPAAEQQAEDYPDEPAEVVAERSAETETVSLDKTDDTVEAKRD